MTEQLVRIGKIIGCHGLRGELKVRPASEDAEWAESIKTLVLQNPKNAEKMQVTVVSTRFQGPLVVIKLREYADRTAAEALIGFTLYTDSAILSPPVDGEFWVDDLIGLTVIDAKTGRKRGVVKDLLSSTGSDFLEIQIDESPQTVVIPFIDQFFPTVDTANRTITVDLLSDFLSMHSEPVTADRLEQ